MADVHGGSSSHLAGGHRGEKGSCAEASRGLADAPLSRRLVGVWPAAWPPVEPCGKGWRGNSGQERVEWSDTCVREGVMHVHKAGYRADERTGQRIGPGRYKGQHLGDSLAAHAISGFEGLGYRVDKRWNDSSAPPEIGGTASDSARVSEEAMM